MNLTLFEAVITDVSKQGGLEVIHRVPMEAEFLSAAKLSAGHILRGAAIQQNDFRLLCYLREYDEEKAIWIIQACASVVKDGAKKRGPWMTKSRLSDAEKAKRKAEREAINKVVWTNL